MRSPPGATFPQGVQIPSGGLLRREAGAAHTAALGSSGGHGARAHAGCWFWTQKATFIPSSLVSETLAFSPALTGSHQTARCLPRGSLGPAPPAAVFTPCSAGHGFPLSVSRKEGERWTSGLHQPHRPPRATTAGGTWGSPTFPRLNLAQAGCAGARGKPCRKLGVFAPRAEPSPPFQTLRTGPPRLCPRARHGSAF